ERYSSSNACRALKAGCLRRYMKTMRGGVPVHGHGSIGRRAQLLAGTFERFVGIKIAEFIPRHNLPPRVSVLETPQFLIDRIYQFERIAIERECSPASYRLSVNDRISKVGSSFDTVVFGGQLMNCGAGCRIRGCA